MKYIVAICLIIGLAGCTAIKQPFVSNETTLTALAPLATGPGCTAAVSGLQPGEVGLICAGINGCSAAICK